MDYDKVHLNDLSRQVFLAENEAYTAVRLVDICREDGIEERNPRLQRIKLYLERAEKLIEKAGDETDKILLEINHCFDKE